MTESLQNADEVHLVNMVRDEFTTIDLYEREVVKYKQEYCHNTFVTSNDNQNKVIYTQNRCPWIPQIFRECRQPSNCEDLERHR